MSQGFPAVFFPPPFLGTSPSPALFSPTSPTLLYPPLLFFLASHSFFLCLLDPNPSVLPASLSQPSVGLSLSALLLSLSLFLCCWFSLCLCVLLSLGGPPLCFSSSLFSSVVAGVHLLSDSVIPVQRRVRVGEAVGCTLGVVVLICCTTASSQEAWWGGVVGGGLS